MSKEGSEFEDTIIVLALNAPVVLARRSAICSTVLPVQDCRHRSDGTVSGTGRFSMRSIALTEAGSIELGLGRGTVRMVAALRDHYTFECRFGGLCGTCDQIDEIKRTGCTTCIGTDFCTGSRAFFIGGYSGF